MTPLASAAYERGGAHSAMLLTELLVQRHQLRVDGVGNRRAFGEQRCHLSVNRCRLMVKTGRDLGARRINLDEACAHIRERLLCILKPLHRLEFDLFKVALALRKHLKFTLQTLKFAGCHPCAEQTSVVSLRARTHRLDVVLSLRHFSLRVAHRGFGFNARSTQARRRRLKRRQLTSRGKGLETMPCLLNTSVHVLDGEQSHLVRRWGLGHVALL